MRKLDKHCPDCDKEIEDRSTFCSSCSKIGKKSPRYKHGLGRHGSSENRKLDNCCIECNKGIDDRAIRCKSCAQKGERNNSYKCGLSNFPKRNRIVNYAKWVKDVLERDNYMCQHCSNNVKLRAHHIYSYDKYPELRLNIDNGITLCEYHHRQLHQLFGNNVTPEQLKWFFEHVK